MSFPNPGNENWKLETETPKFPKKIDFIMLDTV